MPKGKIDGRNRNDRRVVARTNKIGGRSSTKSVSMLSNDDLRSKLTGGRGKDRQRVRNELIKRGAPLVVETVEEAA